MNLLLFGKSSRSKPKKHKDVAPKKLGVKKKSIKPLKISTKPKLRTRSKVKTKPGRSLAKNLSVQTKQIKDKRSNQGYALKVKRKSSIKGPIVRKPAVKQQKGKLIGEITHYFPKIQVAVIKTTHGSLSVGNRIYVRGDHTDFEQVVDSLQIESMDVKVAPKGKLAGLKVIKEVKVKDAVYRI